MAVFLLFCSNVFSQAVPDMIPARRSPLVECSPNVFINKRGAGRLGDHYSSHGCITHPGHQDVIAAGSSSVFINGRPAARVGDAVSIGGTVQDGSGDVFIGG